MDQTLTMRPAARQQARPQRARQLTYTPRADILESEDELSLYVDLPGVRPEALELRVEDGELIVHGRVDSRAPEEDLVHEYGTGDFWRAFRLTHEIDANAITGSLRDGVLVLRLPKSRRLCARDIDVQQG
jgi:HSP20 family protein